jgi:hypothetical protein
LYGLLALLATVTIGCGTTRWSDTSRTATEQMLISDAVDRAVSQIDFSSLAGRTVFLDNRYIIGEVDDRYLYSTLRQHIMASGAVLKEKLDESEFVVEIRTGALGTNRSDLLFGMPATNLPTGGAITGIPSSIPEISLIKRTAQQGVCKVAVFAYQRESGQPIWQSGAHQVVSKAKDVWVFGAGPFQRGSIYNGTRFAGDHVQIPLSKKDTVDTARVCQEIRFPAALTDANTAGPPLNSVNQASHSAPLTPPPNGAPPQRSGSNGSATGGQEGGGNAAPPSLPNKFGALGSQNWENGPTVGGGATTASSNPVAGAVGAMDAYKQAKSALAVDRNSSTATSSTPSTPAAGAAPSK